MEYINRIEQRQGSWIIHQNLDSLFMDEVGSQNVYDPVYRAGSFVHLIETSVYITVSLIKVVRVALFVKHSWMRKNLP